MAASDYVEAVPEALSQPVNLDMTFEVEVYLQSGYGPDLSSMQHYVQRHVEKALEQLPHLMRNENAYSFRKSPSVSRTHFSLVGPDRTEGS